MTMPDPALWRSMLSYLRRNHTDICRQWFEEIEPLWLEAGVLQIRVGNQVQQNYLRSQCADVFRDAAQDATGALIGVRFVTGDGEFTGNGRKTGDAVAAGNGRNGAGRTHDTIFGDDADQIAISPDYSFDNFVIGPGNRLAHAAAVAIAQKPGEAYNPLFIHGGVGLGKTHLLQAACQQLLATRPETHICYLSCDSFINQFMEAVQGGRMHDFRHRYRHVDVLVIDDIHFLANRERTQEEFFHTFNTLHQAKKQIVLSSDASPSEIPHLEERLVSRFNWGLVARIDKPCYETRVAIVKKKAAVRGLALPDDVVCYIASRIESNTRELEGAITKVQSLSMFTDAEVDLSLTQQALGDELPAAAESHVSIQTIIDAVTDFFDVKVTDLQSKRRHRSITIPRQVCMYLARQRTNHSLEEIGGYFGGRDHTTVMHAIRTIDERMGNDPGFASQINRLDQQLHVPVN